ncbi:MAG: FCD domain-containing protein [Actinomycetia bacterium]|nr:FCD domain-containing protein [Actinomycetes bacterium]
MTAEPSVTRPGDDASPDQRDNQHRGFEVALGYLDAQILAGRLSNGSQLPPERDLALQLGVSRGAVREAIRALQAQGIIVTQLGRGHGTRIQSTPSSVLGRILRLQLALDGLSFADLTETRIALEGAACAAAARHRHPEALSRAAALLDQMAGIHDRDRFNSLDTDFHVTLAEAGGNRLTRELTAAIRQVLQVPIRAAEDAVGDWPRLRQVLVTEHTGIYQAIRAGDEDLAAQRAKSHIRNAYSMLQARPDLPLG